MRFFLYEYTCSQPSDQNLPASWRAEGAAMFAALWQDFQSLPGMEMRTLPRGAFSLLPSPSVLRGRGVGGEGALGPDKHEPPSNTQRNPLTPNPSPPEYRGRGENSNFEALCAWADVGLIVAPESNRTLETLVSVLHARCALALNCSGEAIRLTADKDALARFWVAHDVPTPPVSAWQPGAAHPPFPFVLKPRDGAGSVDTMLVAADHQLPTVARAMIAQPLVEGTPASVAFLIGAAGRHALMPARQLLSDDGRFQYLGGEMPLPPPLADRALRLANRAVACVPGLRGYVGVDMILGPSADGSQDFALEINPRLTTSYLGLRALARRNLAGAMLRVVRGEPVEIAWRDGAVCFGVDGATV